MTKTLVIPDFLTEQECLLLRGHFARWQAAGGRPRGDLRRDAALSAVAPDAQAALTARVGSVLGRHFGLPALGLDYAAYTRLMPGGSHPLHADAVRLDTGGPNHTPRRVATAMVYLTEEGADCRGGLLRFPTRGEEYRPAPGLLVGFLTGAEFAHEVTTVEAGERDALAFWFKLNGATDHE